MTMKLPPRITVADARRVDVAAALSPEERALFDAVRLGGSVYASGLNHPGGDDYDSAVVHSDPARDSVRVSGGGRIARRMERAGWFRYSSTTHEGSESRGGTGYFWLTEAAQRVHDYARSLVGASSTAPSPPPSFAGLTAHQVEVLRGMDVHGPSMVPSGYARAGADAARWYRTMFILNQRGLVRRASVHSSVYEITEAGRSAARGKGIVR